MMLSLVHARVGALLATSLGLMTGLAAVARAEPPPPPPFVPEADGVVGGLALGYGRLEVGPLGQERQEALALAEVGGWCLRDVDGVGTLCPSLSLASGLERRALLLSTPFGQVGEVDGEWSGVTAWAGVALVKVAPARGLDGGVRLVAGAVGLGASGDDPGPAARAWGGGLEARLGHGRAWSVGLRLGVSGRPEGLGVLASEQLQGALWVRQCPDWLGGGVACLDGVLEGGLAGAEWVQGWRLGLASAPLHAGAGLVGVGAWWSGGRVGGIGPVAPGPVGFLAAVRWSP